MQLSGAPPQPESKEAADELISETILGIIEHLTDPGEALAHRQRVRKVWATNRAAARKKKQKTGNAAATKKPSSAPKPKQKSKLAGSRCVEKLRQLTLNEVALSRFWL